MNTDRQQPSSTSPDDTHRIFFEHNPLPMYLYDTQTLRFLAVNTAAIKQYGYSREEFLSMTLLDIRPPEEYDRLKRNVYEPWQGLTNVGVWTHRRKCGELFHAQIHFDQFIRDGRQVRLVVAHDITKEKSAESALRASEERFRTVVSTVPDFIIMFDHEGRLRFINRILPGYNMEQVLGSSSYDFIDPAYHEVHREGLRAVFDRGENFTYEVQARGKPDEWRYYLNRITPLKENGVTIAAVQIATDITDRRNAEQALRESEARFRAVVESVPGRIFLIDRSMRIRFVNAGLPGVSRGDAIGKLATDFVADTHRDACTNLILRTIDAGETGSLEIQTSHPATNEKRWAEMRSTPLAHSGGEPQALIITIDIDNRRRAEEQLRESRDFIERFARTAPYIIYVYDLQEHKTVWENRSFTDDLQYTKEQIAAFDAPPLTKLMHPDDLPQVPGWFARWNKTPDGVLLQTEYRLKHSNGTWRTFLGRDVVFLRAADGSAKQIIGSVEDVTERKQLEDQLRQSQKLDSIGRLAGGIAHDFNNLLTSILGHLDLAEQHLPAESQALNDLEVIRLAAERSAELTSQLLSFARKQITQPRLVNMNELMKETQRLLLRVIGENIELIAVPYPTLGRTKVDPGQMTQVLINLVVNARDAMPAGGRLVIETGHASVSQNNATEELPAGEYITLSVTDSGSGMSPEVLRHIFEPFFTTKGVGRGTGLGLATCYGIIKQALGHIIVKTKVGLGSTFTIYLPRVDGSSQLLPAIPRLANAGGTETILLVEDDDMLRNLTTRFLSAQGYNVLMAPNGNAALEVVKSDTRPIALLLTDVVMPRMSGTKLAEELCRLRPGLRVLFMTGYTEEDMTGFDTSLGATGVLNKPFSLPILGKTVRELLDRTVP